MNDTHDVEYRPDKPYPLYPKLKMDHPEWLVGDPIKRSRYGRWSSVDYAVPEIRQLALSYIEEVCRNYDVDGVELDFFRHLCYFKSTARGAKASQAECDMMTDLMRRVRAMSEEQGARRGRPILVAVRVPDSVDFCREMGFDVERWLGNGLVDMLITTCYFRLNPWPYSVALGHKHGVSVYPCLSDSRVLGGERFSRESAESYRGQAMNAWAAGADGIHVFNLFDPKSPVWREVGNPKALRAMPKLYFVTVRDGNPNSYLADGEKHCNLEILTPGQPRHITPTQPMRVPVEIGDDPAWAKQSGRTPRVTCHLWLPRLLHADDVAVSINGKSLASGKLAKGWLDCPVGQGIWKQGENQLDVSLKPSTPMRGNQWSFEYAAKKLPAKPWTRDHGSPRTEEKLVDGGLQIADRGTENGDYHYYRYAWGASADSPLVVEARAKVVSGVNCVILTNGAAQMRLELRPDGIRLWNNTAKRFAMNTTEDFHLYRIETRGLDVKVFVDGTLRIDAHGAFTPRADTRVNQLAFGAANSTDVGEACWALVRARLQNQVCQDVVVRVEP
jgi:hypothetical protein